MNDVIKVAEISKIISDDSVGASIYQKVKSLLQKNDVVVIDMSDVHTMATYCSKQIFGSLYKELGEKFYDRVIIRNASDVIKTSIRLGIVYSMNLESK